MEESDYMRYVRCGLGEEDNKNYYAVIDIVRSLAELPSQQKAIAYWKALKKRLIEEGAGQLFSESKRMKLRAFDGRLREVEVVDSVQAFRIVQSIPSERAETFKLFLAMLGVYYIRKDPECNWMKEIDL